MEKVLFDGKSEFSRYEIIERIYEGRPARVLFSGELSPQSGLALDDDPELLFHYNQRFMEIALSTLPKSILVIGGGAFTLPKALVERFDAKVDAVEVDQLLLELAQKYFDVPDSPNLRGIIADGRAYINACTSRYDMIIVDAFSEEEIPRALITVEAAAKYAHLLTERGVLAMNFIAPYSNRISLTHRLVATFGTAFDELELYQADPHTPIQNKQNFVLVAMKNGAPSLDYVQSVPVELPDGSNERLILTDKD